MADRCNLDAANGAIHQMIRIAAYALRVGNTEAAGLLLDCLDHAARSPQPTPPIHHYEADVRTALFELHGDAEHLAGQSDTRVEAALGDWVWFRATWNTHAEPWNRNSAIDAAAQIVEAGGSGSRARAREALAEERRKRERERADDYSL